MFVLVGPPLPRLHFTGVLKFCSGPACNGQDVGVLKQVVKAKSAKTAEHCGLLGINFQRPQGIFGM